MTHNQRIFTFDDRTKFFTSFLNTPSGFRTLLFRSYYRRKKRSHFDDDTHVDFAGETSG